MRPLLAVVLAVAVLAAGLTGLGVGYRWGSHDKRAAVAVQARQLTLAELGLATRAEVEHDRIVCGRLGFNTPYGSPLTSRAGADVHRARTHSPTTPVRSTTNA